MLSESDLAIRRRAMTSTDLVAVIGLDPNRSAIDVWLEKTGRVEPEQRDAEALRWGHRLEPLIAEDYARKHGVVTVSPAGTMRHPTEPLLVGTPDRLVYEPEQLLVEGEGRLDWRADDLDLAAAGRPQWGLECKSHGHFPGRDYGEAGTDDVPDGKRVQCAVYQAITDLDRWDLHALIDTNKPRTFRIERDRAVEADLLDVAVTFWRRHVEADASPPPDGSASFRRHLARTFALHGPEIVEMSPEGELAAQLAAIRGIRSQLKKLEADHESLEQSIKLAIAGNAGVRVGDDVVTWKQRRSGRLRDAELRQELYARLGLADDEIRELERRFAVPDFRAMNWPRSWTAKKGA